MTKLQKIENAIEQCPSCKTKIYCKLKPAVGDYPAKLQWQNSDGKAHYSFDFATKVTSCGGAVKTEEGVNLSSLGIEKETLEAIGKETETILNLQLARIGFIEQGLKKRGIPFTGAFVGMLYNQQMESLRSNL